MQAVAAQPRQRGRRSGWIDVVDRAVLSLHQSGFLQSLIFHVALLLAMALTVSVPERLATSVRLALAFDAVARAPLDEPDVAVESEPLVDVVLPDPLAADAPHPAEFWVALPDESQPALEAVLAGLEEDHPVTGPEVDEVLAEIPNAGRLAGFAGALDGRHGEGMGRGGGGFGGELGRRLRAAGARTGDVQVSIAWDNFNDVDVHVMVEASAPRRGISLINFSNPRGACGGWLDVDQNIVPTTATAVENVFWARGTAPAGRYTVSVHQFRNWGGPNPTEVHVAVLVDGRQSHHTAVVHADSGPVLVTSFVRRQHAPGRPPFEDFDESMAPSSPP